MKPIKREQLRKAIQDIDPYTMCNVNDWSVTIDDDVVLV